MTLSRAAYTEREKTPPVGTTKKSPPHPSYHIDVYHGLLKAKPTMSCPDKQQCTWCTTYLHSGPCQYKQLQHSCDCFTQACIPARFESATIEALHTTLHGPDTSPSIKKTTKWLMKWCTTQPLPQKGLLLTGAQGTGKSFAMTALIRYLTLTYATHALFLDFQQFIRELKLCYHKKDNDYELFDNLRKKEILVLDDVHPLRNSSWIREVLHTIIAQRYNDCSRTFLTTNLSMTHDFKEWATPHTFSRLKEMCYWLPFSGPDRRMTEI